MKIRDITLSVPALLAFGLMSVALAQSAPDAPSLENAKQMSENQKGDGVHYAYTSSTSAVDLVKSYSQQLKSEGWTIRDSGGGGSAWGGGANLVATKGNAYLVLEAGGAGETHANLCVWPAKPSNDEC